MIKTYPHHSVERALIAVMDAFSDIRVNRYDDEGKVLKEHVCPIFGGHQSVAIARQRLTEKTSPNIKSIFPRMGLSIRGLTRDTDRLENPQNWHNLPEVALKAGIPYRLSLRLTAYFKYLENGLQIIEAIGSQFDPHVFIHMFQAPSIMRASAVPLTLDSDIPMDFGQTTFTEGFDRGDDGILKAHFDLSLPIWLWTPTVTDGGAIHDVCLNFVDLCNDTLLVQNRWRAIPTTSRSEAYSEYDSSGSVLFAQRNENHHQLMGNGLYAAQMLAHENFYIEWTGSGKIGMSVGDVKPLDGTSGSSVSAQLETSTNSSSVFKDEDGEIEIITAETPSPPIRGGMLCIRKYGSMQVFFFFSHDRVTDDMSLRDQVTISGPHEIDDPSRLSVDLTDGQIEIFSETTLDWQYHFVTSENYFPEFNIGYSLVTNIEPLSEESHVKTLSHILTEDQIYAREELSESETGVLYTTAIPSWVPDSPGVCLTAMGEYIFYDTVDKAALELRGLSRGAMASPVSKLEKSATITFVKPSITRTEKYEE